METYFDVEDGEAENLAPQVCIHVMFMFCVCSAPVAHCMDM